jgi:CrcB protein
MKFTEGSLLTLMAKSFLIGAFGLAGIYLRFFLNIFAERSGIEVPYMTMAINLIGSFLIGTMYIVGIKIDLPEVFRIAITVGLLGGFTTFSTFSLETILLFTNGRYYIGSLYILGSVLGGLAACLLGILTAKAVVG